MNASRPENKKTIAALILAAGQGTRMGLVPKCLIHLDHQPIILRQIVALKLAGIHNITVVTGFYHAQIESVLSVEPTLHIVRNIAPEQGQQSSVRLGLAHVPDDPDVVLIALADQPLLNEQDLQELVCAYITRPVSTEIMYPVVDGQRGNPVLMSATSVKEFLRNDTEVTCRKYIDTHASHVYKYSTQNDHFIADLDTQDDLKSLAERTGLSVKF